MGNVAEKQEKSNGHERHPASNKHAAARKTVEAGEPLSQRGALVDTSEVAVCARAVLNTYALKEIKCNLKASYGDIASLSEFIEGACRRTGEHPDDGREAIASLLAHTKWALKWLSGIERAVRAAEHCAQDNGLPVPAVAVLAAPVGLEPEVAVGANGIQDLLRAALQGETAAVTQ